MPASPLARPATIAALAAAIVVVALMGWLLLVGPPERPDSAAAGLVGGAFALVDQQGETRRDSEFRGRLMLVYFGFTNCADVCPATLSVMAAALEALGEAASRVVPVFITVDPKRDTVDRLKEYAAHFDPRLVALTGEEAALAKVAADYRVYYKAGEGAQYQVDHSSVVYLMGADGRFLAHFDATTTPEEMAAAIRSRL